MRFTLRQTLRRMPRPWRAVTLVLAVLALVSGILIRKLTVFGNTWIGVVIIGTLMGVIMGAVLLPAIDALDDEEDSDSR